MSEDHIKTVVIDLPIEQRADDEAHDEPRNEPSADYESTENKPAMPSSWLS